MIIFPLLASLFFGIQFIPQKLAGNPKAELYNLSLILGIAISSVIPFAYFTIIDGLKDIFVIPFILSFFGGLVWSFGSRLTLVGINEIGMAKTTVIMNFCISTISFIFGIVFFSETPSILKYIGIPILMTGAIFVAIIGENNNKKVNIIGVLSVAASSIFISANNVLTPTAIASPYFPTIPFYTAVMFMGLGAVLGGFLSNLKPSKLCEWKDLKKSTHYYGILAGIIILVGFEFTMFTLSEFGLSFGVPIIQSMMIVISAFFGIIYFKEIMGKKKISLYIIGTGISIFGVILFSL
ncbi:MAG: GRP family sugar transporter [Candidatus Helarchaeota archaeon]